MTIQSLTVLLLLVVVVVVAVVVVAAVVVLSYELEELHTKIGNTRGITVSQTITVEFVILIT